MTYNHLFKIFDSFLKCAGWKIDFNKSFIKYQTRVYLMYFWNHYCLFQFFSLVRLLDFESKTCGTGPSFWGLGSGCEVLVVSIVHSSLYFFPFYYTVKYISTITLACSAPSPAFCYAIAIQKFIHFFSSKFCAAVRSTIDIFLRLYQMKPACGLNLFPI